VRFNSSVAQRTVVAAVDDVLFVSRLEEVARAQGTRLLLAKNPQECLAHLGSTTVDLVIFDMNARTFDSGALMDALAGGSWVGKVRIVGFVRHTDEAKIKLIQSKGCSEILPRSAFVKQLPQLLSGSPLPTKIN
jgi:DNA-binding NarL/FixJ family response regulator